jgi:MFS family permease
MFIEGNRSMEGRSQLGRLPHTVWALGFVSMFMDISSEMIHSLLPVFLVVSLGATTEVVGLIEGVGEATASISKLFSGWISDRLGKRKALTVVGYGLGALSKPFFAIAPTPLWVLGARFSDRIGKGIRGAMPLSRILCPRRFVAPHTVSGNRIDTVGAFAGPLFALAIMETFNNDFRLVFWLAVVPGIAAVTIPVVAVREPAPPREMAEAGPPARWIGLGRLGNPFWTIVAVGLVLTLARFSEAFLVLRAVSVGFPTVLVPLVFVVMNIVYGACAYPWGALSDCFDRKLMLAVGFLVLILANILLAIAAGILVVMIGVGLWGLHMGMTQGLLAALVADAAPKDLRGTAFGFFNFASGIALLLASLIAGVLWQVVGPSATFVAGATFTVIGLLGSEMFIGR